MASTCCHHDHCSAPEPGEVDPGWRRALWIALEVNLGMFLIEITAGVAAGSASLQADALDFAGDAGNYAISLGVAGMALGWRARAALAKGLSLAVLAAWVIATVIWHAIAGTLPSAETMGVVGVMALAANAWVAVMLYRYRSGDANMRSVWICSRNDAIGNAAVVLAAAGVFGTGTGWPDVFVATAMAALGISGCWQIVRQATGELRGEQPRLAAAEWPCTDEAVPTGARFSSIWRRGSAAPPRHAPMRRSGRSRWSSHGPVRPSTGARRETQ